MDLYLGHLKWNVSKRLRSELRVRVRHGAIPSSRFDQGLGGGKSSAGDGGPWVLSILVQ
jgi:hypothetical protein